MTWRRRLGVFHTEVANLALRRRWFRVGLHIVGMIRRPRNAPWHWQCIRREFHEPTNHLAK